MIVGDCVIDSDCEDDCAIRSLTVSKEENAELFVF
jgi:hypothetical protein